MRGFSISKPTEKQGPVAVTPAFSIVEKADKEYNTPVFHFFQSESE